MNNEKTPSLKAQKSALTKEIKAIEEYLTDLKEAITHRSKMLHGEIVTGWKIKVTEAELKSTKKKRAELDYIIIVTAENIKHFEPYTGTIKELAIGDSLKITNRNVPCVMTENGKCKTFAIACHNSLIDPKNEERKLSIMNEPWAFNRYSINTKFLK